MQKKSKPVILSLLVIAIILGLIWEINPLPSARARLENVPMSGLHFAGKELPLTEEEQLALGAAFAIKRLYIYKGNKFILTITDGSNNRNAVHDPTYCFLGGGWQIEGDLSLQLGNGEARQLNLSRNGETARVLYWFSNGKQSYSSVLQYWGETTMRRLTMGLHGEEPILVLLRPINDTNVDWDAVAHHFIPLIGL